MTQTNFKCLLCLKNDFEGIETIKTSCNHRFCLVCLGEYVKKNLNCRIKCPFNKCCNNISDFNIRKVLDESLIGKYERLCLEQCDDCHCCLLPECGNCVAYRDKNIQYDCVNCTLFNCIMCGAAHKNLSCNEYKLNATTNGRIVCQNELDRARTLFLRKSAESYRKFIMEAADKPILPNTEIFMCQICVRAIEKAKGVQLKNCFHHLCRKCLRDYVKNATEIPILCPNGSCQIELDDSECRHLLSKNETGIYENKSMSKALPTLTDAFQCKYPDCKNLVLISGYNQPTWTCNLCKSVNCLKCKKVHEGKPCDETLSPDEILIKEKIKKKELMECPNCKNLIMKAGGCNWIQCSSCNTELCWILQTYRWGPKGRGDTSGGCKCGVNGKKCHVECWGCIPDNRPANRISDNLIDIIPDNPPDPVQNTAKPGLCQIM